MATLKFAAGDVLYVPWAEERALVWEAIQYTRFSQGALNQVVLGGNWPPALERPTNRFMHEGGYIGNAREALKRRFDQIGDGGRRLWILAHGGRGSSEIGGSLTTGDGPNAMVEVRLSPAQLVDRMREAGFDPGRVQEILVFACYAGQPGGFAHALYLVLRERFPERDIQVRGFRSLTGTAYTDGTFDCIDTDALSGDLDMTIDYVEDHPSSPRVRNLRRTLMEEDFTIYPGYPMRPMVEASSSSSRPGWES